MIGESLSDFARRPPSEPIVAAIRADLAEIDRRATTTRSVTLLTTGLGAMAAIHVTHELAFAKADGQIVLWRKWLDRLLEIAPGRSDQAIPFFTAALAQSAFPVVAEISAALLARNANDPVGLYYRGLTLAVDSQAETRERGRAMIGQSLDAGIERFMPIDAALKRELGR